jgi:hypothetical protein
VFDLPGLCRAKPSICKADFSADFNRRAWRIAHWVYFAHQF